MTTAIAWMGAVQLTALSPRQTSLARERTAVLDALYAAARISDENVFDLAYGGKWY